MRTTRFYIILPLLVVSFIRGYAENQFPSVLRAGTCSEASMAEWLTDSIDALIEDAIDQGAFPGAQILIARNGVVVHDKSYGEITEGGPSVTPNTLYDLASVSKAIGTLPAVMLAVDRGYIDIDKPLSHYYKPLQETDKKDLTVREFLFHETGMPAALNMFAVMMDDGKPGGILRKDIVSEVKTQDNPVEMAENMFVGNAAMDTIMNRICHIGLRKDKSYNYSCLNFALLKAAVESATGVEMSHWCDSLLWKPLGLNNMCYRPKERFPLDSIAPTELDTLFRKQLVHGYVHDEMAAFSGGIQGNAGLFANTGDIARICRMWLNNGEYDGVRILKPETVELFIKTVSPTCRRGLGFDKPDVKHPENSPTTELANASTFGHLGFTGTMFWVDPVNDLIVVFLTNRVNPTRNNAAFARLNVRPDIMRLALKSISESNQTGRE